MLVVTIVLLGLSIYVLCELTGVIQHKKAEYICHRYMGCEACLKGDHWMCDTDCHELI